MNIGIPPPAALVALAALRRFTDAAVALDVAWGDLGPFDVLTDTCPRWLPNWDEVLTDVIAWRDAAAAALGQPGGDTVGYDEALARMALARLARASRVGLTEE